MKAVADTAIDARAARGTAGRAGSAGFAAGGRRPRRPKRKMNTAELRDNLLTFIVAGHETTALTLAWSLYLLALSIPEFRIAPAPRSSQSVVQRRRPRETMSQSCPSSDRSLTRRCAFIRLRRIVSRTAQEQIHAVCGREGQRAGDTVMIPIYALHRHHLLWPRPG